MSLTAKQIGNIHHLDCDTLIEIMHECAEALGVVSVDEFSKLMNIPRRTVYAKIKDNKIKYVDIAGKLPCVNANL